jgi:poly-gamma-glutamate synthesis protein (capsule biosynthesis protein)
VHERSEKIRGFINKLKNDIHYLKGNGAEYIIMCLHIGGQYNIKPLDKTKKIVNKMMDYGVDVVIGNHEHVIHNCEIDRMHLNKIKIFSLGNFAGCSGLLEEPYDKMAEYSVLFNLYLSKDIQKVKLVKCSFTVVKNIFASDGKVKTVLLYNLINQCSDIYEKQKLLEDNLKIYNTFMNSNKTKIDLKLEYSL